MAHSAQALTLAELATAIVPNPLMLAAKASVADAIDLMYAGGDSDQQLSEMASQQALIEDVVRQSGVLVLEDDRVAGMVTQRDLVRLVALGHTWVDTLADVAITAAMTSPVNCLNQADLTDLFAPLEILQRRAIGCLPLVDAQGSVEGCLTYLSLMPLLNALDLLHLRRVEEVMTTRVVYACPKTSLAELAALMTTQGGETVVIREFSQVSASEVLQDDSAQIALHQGIVTERDVVQGLALGLNLAVVPAEAVMHPPRSVSVGCSLGMVSQQMQGQPTQPLLVTDGLGIVLGLVTQADLFKVLQPSQLCRMVETLEQKVARLEAENLSLRQSRNAELEQQVQARTAELYLQTQQERLLSTIADQIRSSLELSEVLDAAVAGVRSLLQCDRVLIYQFKPDWSGSVVAESVGAGWATLLHDLIEDRACRDTILHLYRQGRKIAVDHVGQMDYADCHLEMLNRYQVKAFLVVPILVSNHLWGLATAHQCDNYRTWLESELALLDKIGVHLAIAIQQATTYQQAQMQLVERQRAEHTLQVKVEELDAFFSSAIDLLCIARTDGYFLRLNPEWENILGYPLKALEGQRFIDFIHPDDVEATLTCLGDLSQGQAVNNFTNRYRCRDGTYRWIEWRSICPRGDIIFASARDITARKQAEAQLQASEQFLRTIYNGIELAVFVVDVLENDTFRYVGFNPAAERLSGKSSASVQGNTPIAKIRQHYHDCVQAGVPITYEECLEFQGQATWWLTTLNPIRDQLSRICRIVGTSTSINDRKQAEVRLEIQTVILERIAKAHPLTEVLEELIRLIKTQLVDGLCSIVLCSHDNTLNLVVAPQLPPLFNQALQAIQSIPIGENCGSCGTAIFRKETVVVADIATDPLWAGCKDLPLAHGLLACWSTPIVASDGRVLGTFAVYYRAIQEPQPQELEIVSLAANMASIAIEREQASTALQDSEEKFRQFAENSHGIVLIRQFDPAQLLYVNSAYERIWGRSCTSLYADPTSWMEALHPEDCDRIDAAYQAIADTHTFDQEYRIIRPDGSIRWVWARCFPIHNASGQIYRSAALIEDISDRKAAELALQQLNQDLEAKVLERTLALQQSEERWQLALRGSNDGIFDWDLRTNQVFYSSRWKAMRGFADHEIGDSLEECISRMHPDDHERVRTAIAEHMAGHTESVSVEYRTRCKDGTYLWILARGQAIWDETGQAIRMSGSDTDISDRKRAEQALRRYERMVQASEDSMVLIDRNYTYQIVNQAAERDYDQPAAAMIGHSLSDLCGSTLFNDVLKPDLDRCLAGEVIRHDQWMDLPKIGRQFMSISYSPYFEADQTVSGVLVSARNMTDLKRVEEALRLSERRYASLAAAAPVAIFRFDRPMNCVYVNERWSEMTGRPAETALGQGWIEALHPEDREQLVADWSTGYPLTNTDVLYSEGRHLRPDGSINWFYVQLVEETDIEGNVIGYVGTLTDITERKQAELALEQEVLRRQMIFNTASDGIHILDAQGNIAEASDRFAEMLGYTPDEVTQLNVTDWDVRWSQAELRQMFRNLASETYAGPDARVFETMHRRKDGSIFEVEINFRRTMLYEQFALICSARDISERKEAERALQKSQRFIERIADASPNILYLYDLSEQRLLYVNRQVTPVLGYSPEEIRNLGGDLIPSIIHPDDLAHIPDYIAQINAAQDGEILEFEYRVRHADGKWCWLHNWDTVFSRDSQGQVQQTVGSVQDISDRKHYEAQLEYANAELTRATRLKDEFLANMSHELRTPLNAILGMAEILLINFLGELTERQRQAISTIETSGQHLLDLINDILEVSKIEAGKLELNLAPTDLTQLCQSSLAFIKQQAIQKRIYLDFISPAQLPALMLDERRMRQVLINLLSNAVKFTPPGGQVRLEVSRYQPPEIPPNPPLDSGAWIQIAVIDTGIGIATVDQPKLFKPFVQIDSSLSRQYEGTGLGLTLVKQIVELHGGIVQLQSELGQGSCFTVYLPDVSTENRESIVVEEDHFPSDQPPEILEAIGEVAQTHTAISPLILIAEDNPSNSELLVNFLNTMGYRLILAQDGQTAVDYALHQKPDLILMDIQMPIVDGLEAIRQIRQDPQLVHVPIIALTALAMANDRDRCLAAGANDYLAKPIKLMSLSATIQHWLSIGTHSPSG